MVVALRRELIRAHSQQGRLREPTRQNSSAGAALRRARRNEVANVKLLTNDSEQAALVIG